MTDDLIARAKAALEGVMPGPWGATLFCRAKNDDGSIHESFKLSNQRSIYGSLAERDARFIAAARQLVPDLIAALEARDARIAELEKELNWAKSANQCHWGAFRETKDRAEAAEARVRELEGALREIADGAFNDNGDVTMNHGHMIRAFFKARAALEGEK